MSGYRVSSSRIDNPNDLEQDWLALQARADCSYFQSWGWVGTWLKQVASDLQPCAVRVWFGDKLVGLGIFVHRDLRRRFVFTSSALFLNEYPFDGRNMSIEYNGVLADPDHRHVVYGKIICHLFEADATLDEVFLGAVDAGAVPPESLLETACQHDRPDMQVLEESSTWAVELESLDDGMDGFLKTLSKNRRGQIRRSLRLYEASGPLQIEAAADTATAHKFLDGLKELHTRRWQRVGRQGAFDNPVWEDFHRTLVETRFRAGEIQLLQVSSGESVIGYLYNLVWRKRVHVLQTGFNPGSEKGMMPGYVVHAMAIGHNMDCGMSLYDLMHGDDLYKKIMCRQHGKLIWLVLQRRRWRFMAERQLLTVKRKLIPAR